MRIQTLLASSVLAAALASCSSPQTCGQNCSADDQLSLQVLRTINSNPALLADLLRVQVSDHVVYLNGSTDTRLEYVEAEEAARSVSGVLRVVNKIEVRNRYS